MSWLCMLLVLVRAKLSESHCSKCWDPFRSSLYHECLQGAALGCRGPQWAWALWSCLFGAGLEWVDMPMTRICAHQAVQEWALQPSQQWGGWKGCGASVSVEEDCVLGNATSVRSRGEGYVGTILHWFISLQFLCCWRAVPQVTAGTVCPKTGVSTALHSSRWGQKGHVNAAPPSLVVCCWRGRREQEEGVGGWWPLPCAQPWADMWLLRLWGEQPSPTIIYQTASVLVHHWAASDEKLTHVWQLLQTAPCFRSRRNPLAGLF